MTDETDMKSEIERRVEAMPEEMRDHLKILIYSLVRCYEEGTKEKALLIFGSDESMNDIITVNCNAIDASQLLAAASDIYSHINTRGAPPKEMFN